MPEPVQLHPSPLRPNWRLKAAREQQGWSQQKLAGRLGVTANSVSRWERGINSPGLSFRRQLCDVLGKSAEELGLLPDKSATSNARSPALPIWHVPYQRNPLFTGREEELMLLHQRLQSGKQGVPQALCGLAGIGKTQMAVEYCYRFSEEYQAVFWVRADTPETLLTDCVALATLLELPERKERDQQRVVEAVKGWLKAQRDWLLVLDNLEDVALIQQVVPSIHQGHILLTMRAQATGTLVHGIDVPKMEPEEAVLFLLRRAKYLAVDAQLSGAAPEGLASAKEITQLLDGLPLALDQAGAYIEETACRMEEYPGLYQAKRATLLHLRGGTAADHPASVAVTLSLVIERVEALDARAADLLRLCAFLHPDSIPEDMIVEGVAPDDSVLGPLVCAPYALDAAIKTLRNFSLIQRHPESKTLSLHRLVQAVLQDRMDESVRRQWVQRTVELVSRAFPYGEDAEAMNWPRCQRYLPQALTCAALIEDWQIVTYEAGVLLLRTGVYLSERIQYIQAEEMLLRARMILLSSVGEMHADYAQSLNDLGLLYHYQGNYEQAEALYQQSLRTREQILGTEHPRLAESLNNLGGLYYNWGQYTQAIVILRSALAMYERLLGPENPMVARSLHNLGSIHLQRGQYEQAEPLLLRAVAVREKLLGAEHPLTLLSLGLLANLYAARKQYAQAEELHQRILALREKQLGAGHAQVAVSLHSLARLYHEQGQCEQAEAFYRRALIIYERALGPQHPRLVQTLNGLAQLLLEHEQVESGEDFCLRALTIRERTLRLEHPDYAESLATLALLAERRGDESKAMQLYQQVLAICEDKLVQEHPLVVRCRVAYNRLLAKGQAPAPATHHPSDTAPVPDAASEQAVNPEPIDPVQIPLADFLAACCARAPRAWCRTADLWAAYQRWVQEHGERFPLSRRAFARALKQQGYTPDRTNASRIWRGIALHQRKRGKE